VIRSRKLILFAFIVSTSMGCQLFHGSLIIDAQIIYNLGGPQPVARQYFYLLDVDPMSLDENDDKYRAKIDSLKGQEREDLEKTAALFMSVKKLLTTLVINQANNKELEGRPPKELFSSLEMSKPFWESHIIQSVQTDFKGHAVFENLSTGTYWLMGITETRAAFTFWSLKVSVGRGENKLMLDQNNALFSK
jgi:hypothetical protein